MVVDLLVANAHKQEDVPPSDDRLVRVVRIQVKTAPDEYPGEDVTGCGNSLARFSSNGKDKVEISRTQRLFPSGLLPVCDPSVLQRRYLSPHWGPMSLRQSRSRDEMLISA